VMSHTAVVAREVGIPCVVNTKLASRTVATGDLVRVDGARGTIEILSRATESRTMKLSPGHLTGKVNQ
jgi:phosphoenolpyruvate-protein kinase (PTS system EI component)